MYVQVLNNFINLLKNFSTINKENSKVLFFDSSATSLSHPVAAQQSLISQLYTNKEEAV